MVSPSPPRPHPAACLPSSTPFSRRLPPPPQVLLDPDPFLTELTRLYDRTRAAGTVWVTFKRSTLSPKKREREAADAPADSFRCLVRATDGKKKISTSVRLRSAHAPALLMAECLLCCRTDKYPSVQSPRPTMVYAFFSGSHGLPGSYGLPASPASQISAKEQARFQAAYATVLRAHMDALKKREKKDKKKPPGSKSLAA
eukprot:SM000362S13788  [mRNA]  locus=s362:34319:35491:+ [translate_table: standard]